MERLTKVEEDIMNLFWENGPSTVSQLIAGMDDPKPPHSTISSIVRILEKKGFLDHKSYGRTYEYFSIIEQKSYSKYSIKKIVNNYFKGSFKELVSYLAHDEDIDLKDMQEILDKLKNDQS